MSTIYIGHLADEGPPLNQEAIDVLRAALPDADLDFGVYPEMETVLTGLENEEMDLLVIEARLLPARLDFDLEFCAALPRRNARTAWVSPTGKPLAETEAGDLVVCRDPLHAAQLRNRLPDRKVLVLDHIPPEELLAEMMTRDAAGALLPACDLAYSNFAERITEELDEDKWVPRAGTGAMVLVCPGLNRQLAELLKPINHDDSLLAVELERRVLEDLNVPNDLPIGVHAMQTEEGTWRMAAAATLPDGSRSAASLLEAAPGTGMEPLDLADLLVEDMVAQGALVIIDQLNAGAVAR